MINKDSHTKYYKVRIPSMIRKEDAGKAVIFEHTSTIQIHTKDFISIPDDWVEEITEMELAEIHR